MRSTTTRALYVAASFWLVGGFAIQADPTGTAFTYQGQLKEGGVPASGEYDFVFRLFDAAGGPSQVGDDRPVNNWPVTDGLFSAQIDFGAGVFTGDALWLEVSVRPGDSGGGYTTLGPRQRITATPHALQTRGLFVDDSLNVGIGTASPQKTLDVAGDGKFTGGDIQVWSGDKAVTLRQDSSDTFLSNKADFVGCGSEPNGRLVLNGEGGVHLKYGSEGSSGTDGLIVDATGNVGIGTAIPDATLQVVNDEDEWAIWAQSPRGGVYGLKNNTAGTDPGVHGETNSVTAEASGVHGVVGTTDAGAGSAGVRGTNEGTGAAGGGVWGEQMGSGVGVYGTCPDGIGVFGKATGAEGENIAVKGRTFSDNGYAGYFQGGRNYFEGNVGIGTDVPTADLDVHGVVKIGGGTGAGSITALGWNGHLNATIDGGIRGSFTAWDSISLGRARLYVNNADEGILVADVKSFVTPNPLDSREDIWYACVEGPEAAMYVRGTGQLVDGRATIELPEHFRLLAVEESMTVQLTPRSFDSKGLAVGRQTLDGIEVGELHGGRGNYEFHWEAKAVRRAHQNFKVTRPWTHVMPAGSPSKDELWAARLRSIEQRKQRIQEMESRLAGEHKSESE